MSTLAPPSTTPEHASVSDELDLLIPPSMSPAKKLIVALLLMGATLGITSFVSAGYVYPTAFQADRLDAQLSHVDSEAGTFAVTVWLQNNSSRTVRLTEIDATAQGAEFVGATVTSYDRTTAGFAEIRDTTSSSIVSLPVELVSIKRQPELGDGYLLTLWLRPTSCETQTDSWGSLEATVDFGEWSFPPLSTTTSFDTPLWASTAQNGRSASITSGEQHFQANGPLEVACEALR